MLPSVGMGPRSKKPPRSRDTFTEKTAAPPAEAFDFSEEELTPPIEENVITLDAIAAFEASMARQAALEPTVVVDEEALTLVPAEASAEDLPPAEEILDDQALFLALSTPLVDEEQKVVEAVPETLTVAASFLESLQSHIDSQHQQIETLENEKADLATVHQNALEEAQALQASLAEVQQHLLTSELRGNELEWESKRLRDDRARMLQKKLWQAVPKHKPNQAAVTRSYVLAFDIRDAIERLVEAGWIEADIANLSVAIDKIIF